MTARTTERVSVQRFLARHRVFTHDEFDAARIAAGSRNANTHRNLLQYHLGTGRIVALRRGLYASVPSGVPPGITSVDPYEIAAKLAPDAVLAYHTALDLHGRSYSVFYRFSYLTATRPRPFALRGDRYQGVLVPKELRLSGQADFATTTVDRRGAAVRVTTLERTLVDVLDRPDLGGGWEEIWRSLESVPYFDLDQIVQYATLLDHTVTTARVGFFLEQHREALMVPQSCLDALRERGPRSPVYFDPARRPGRFLAAWNLVIPQDVLDRSWEEPYEQELDEFGGGGGGGGGDIGSVEDDANTPRSPGDTEGQVPAATVVLREAP